jgi:elongation factor Ts
MEITTELIKALRDQTGVSVMQCKKALEEAGGDRDKALIILQKKSGEIAAKKGDRTLGSAIVASYIHAGGSVGAMVELSCETDFVSKNEEFKKLAYDIAMHVAALKPKYNRMDSIPEDEKSKAKEVFAKEVEGKPAELKDKILEGKINAYFKEWALMEQPFVKNPDVTVGGLISQAVQKFGERVEVTRFVRYAVGQE